MIVWIRESQASFVEDFQYLEDLLIVWISSTAVLDESGMGRIQWNRWSVR